MPSISRPLDDRTMHFSLGEEAARLATSDTLERGGRSARTLVKDGPLRVTLIAIAPGGSIAPHRALGPITVQALSGTVRFRAAGQEWLLQPGEMLSLGAGVEHEVGSEPGGAFLLTVAAPEPAAQSGSVT